MSSLRTALSSPRFNYFILALGVIVLAAGAATLGFKLTGSSDGTNANSAADLTLPSAHPLENAQGVAVHRFEQLDPEIRTTIRTFLSTVVARRNIGRSWSVIGPSIKAGYTYKRWVHANALPVQYYPVGNLNTAGYSLDEATDREILVEAPLTAKPKSGMQPTTFELGLVPVGSGAKAKWLVNYFEPRSSATFPG